MRASELIKKLQEQIELHGDYEVWVDSYNYDFDYDDSHGVYEICFDEEEKRFVV